MNKLINMPLFGEGLGEVVSAEHLNEIDDSLKERTSLALADHQRGRQGEYAHKGPRWAEAVACISVVESQVSWGHKQLRTLWANGFASDPTFRQSSNNPSDANYSKSPWLEIEWAMHNSAPQIVTYGLSVDAYIPSDITNDWRYQFRQEGAMGAIRFWRYHFEPDGNDPHVAFYDALKHLWLMVRVVE